MGGIGVGMLTDPRDLQPVRVKLRHSIKMIASMIFGELVGFIVSSFLCIMVRWSSCHLCQVE